MSDEREVLNLVHSARDAAFGVFTTRFDEMRENAEFMRMDQYSATQLKKFKGRGLTPYVFDYMSNGVDTFQGIQRDNRTEVFYHPKEKDDDVKAEVLNVLGHHVLQHNEFDYLETDVFQDGLVEKVGVIGYEYTNEKDPNGMLELYRLPARHIMWDLASREYDKSDASWISAHRLFRREHLLRRYPERADEIRKMVLDVEKIAELDLNMSYLHSLADERLDAVSLIEFYERMSEVRYFILDGNSGLFLEKVFRSRKQADEYVMDALQQEMAIRTEMEARGEILPRVSMKVIRRRWPVVRKIEMAVDKVFDDTTIEEPFIPISIYHPYFHNGEWWSLVDTMKDPQKYLNKMAAQVDHWISTMAKGLLLIDGNAPKAEADDVIAKFGKTGGAVKVKNVDNYKLVESRGPAPQLFQMMDFARTALEDKSGGRNFQGRKESASESGVAVRTRVERGSLSGFLVFDNLRRWKRDVGEKMAWYMTNYLTRAQMVRISGAEVVQATMQALQQSEAKDWFTRSNVQPGVGYMEVNTTPKNTIAGLKVDVVVDEARWAPARNEMLLQQITAAMQGNPMLAQAFDPMTIIDLLPLPFSQKQKARQNTQQLMQRQQQIEEMKLVKPPNVSASLSDIAGMPMSVVAQFLEKFFGIKLTEPIESPEAQKQAMEQMRSMQQMQLDREKHQMSMEMERQKAGQKMALERAKGEQDLEMAADKAEMDAATTALKASVQGEAAMRKASQKSSQSKK